MKCEYQNKCEVWKDYRLQCPALEGRKEECVGYQLHQKLERFEKFGEDIMGLVSKLREAGGL